jgi:tetratricopeptide (TPR) repeat protein
MIMNTMKYFILGIALMGVSATATAQDGTKADIDAVKNLISSKPADMDKQLTAFQKKNKKNAENLVAFAEAFYEAKDTARARSFAEFALKANSKYAPAYIMLGDIAALSEDGGGAAGFYDQAIYFDPKNPEAYRKYASVYRKISPAGAIAKLNDLRAQLPDYPVDAIIGHINYISNNFDEAIAAYDKVPAGKLEKMDIIESAFSAYLTQKYDKGIQMAELGLQKEPRNSTLNRLAMFCNTEKGNFDKAIDYADRLFNKSDSANISYMDYVYYGNALNGLKRHDEAIAQYKKALEQEFDNADKKAGVVKTLSDAYKGINDFDNAIKYYEQFLADVSKASASDQAGLGRLYAQHASILEDQILKLEKLKKADEVYASLLTKYTDIEDYVAFQRARIGMQMDPDSKEEIAKPHYEKLVELLGSKANRDDTDKARLIEAYRYLISYYLINKDDKATAKQFAAKLQEVDPENETAKQVLELK